VLIEKFVGSGFCARSLLQALTPSGIRPFGTPLLTLPIDPSLAVAK
jgi:hypothetical protein